MEEHSYERESRETTFIQRCRMQGPQVTTPKDQMGVTPFSPGPGCHKSTGTVGFGCFFLPQNWHEEEQANLNISRSDLPFRGLGIPDRNTRLEARQMASGFMMLRTDFDRGEVERPDEEGSRNPLKDLLTDNRSPRFLGGMKVKM